jgi:hypothetical protein
MANEMYSNKFETLHNAFLGWVASGDHALGAVDRWLKFLMNKNKDVEGFTERHSRILLAIILERMFHKEFDIRIMKEHGYSIINSLKERIECGDYMRNIDRQLTDIHPDNMMVMSRDALLYSRELDKMKP